jgi:hypothetical protein
MKNLSFFIFLLVSSTLFAQVSIDINNSLPDSSAMLDVKSTTKGILIPRMSQVEILAISNPANGLQVFCTTDSKLYIYVSTLGQWKEVPYGSGILGQPFPCGIAITINHIAGVVAPVTKTVTYGTVTNIPGETSKCWITSNLGADHQATAADDATEASAGWYWQFNRKQGYKHDGTTRTPNTNWITSIDENFDWQCDNDPCTLEIGTGWRLPTYTEWFNVDVNGDWTNRDGPWNSALKMHANGFLFSGDGFLYFRGLEGYYWSRSQYSDITKGSMLSFNSGYSSMVNTNKANGFSLRCLRDN